MLVALDDATLHCRAHLQHKVEWRGNISPLVQNRGTRIPYTAAKRRCHGLATQIPFVLVRSVVDMTRLAASLQLAVALVAPTALAALNASAILEEYFGADAPWYTPRIPLFQSSDNTLNDVYYYRWSIFRAHQRDLGALGFISTEFLDDVSWQLNPYASLNDATGFHLGEGRWLRDRRYAHDYIDFM